jgi:hypothetical protein
MTRNLRVAYEAELVAARRATAQRDFECAFEHLGRAHILGQRVTWRHVHVHFGQLSRIAAAAMFSRVWVPAGNTGRASVSALKSMPLPDDLRILLMTRDV